EMGRRNMALPSFPGVPQRRYTSIPTYLPVTYQVLNTDLAFFLKENNQDFMRNSSLMSRTESFFIYQARSLPSVNSSYGPLSVEQPVPIELLQNPGSFPASSLFTVNWKVQTFIMNTKIHLAKPKVQVLFYIAGRDWDDYSAINKLPCVHMFAQEGHFGSYTSTPLRRIGGVRLYQNSIPLQLAEHRLDHNFMVLVPATPGRQVQQLLNKHIFVRTHKVAHFGSSFTSQKSAESLIGTISFLHSSREDMGVQRVLQVDLKIESFPELPGSRWMAWQVEYPASRSATQEADTEIRLAQEDVAGIVPLAMNTEILNTAVLTGKTVAVPVKVVTIGIDASVTDVSEAVECRTTDEDVVKVSERCDYVFVNGKEMKGKVKMAVNFTYAYLSAQLELNVWIPRLPLQIEVSDTELSQIKGWRVPIMRRRKSDAEEEQYRRGRGCTLQYQHAMVRVLTHFVAESADPRSQTSYMLGTDWQADITELVGEFLKVENPQIAQLLDKRILMGRDVGMTTIQVLSPLSDSILAERTVTVLDDKVTIAELGVQLVTGYARGLADKRMCPVNIFGTRSLLRLEMEHGTQEALISAWLQFSDGSVAPLDLYNSDFFSLTATSLDEDVVTVQQNPSWKWPVIVTEAEGQGLLVKVEMTVCEICQKFKRRSVLATGNCHVKVKFGYSDSSRGGSNDYGTDGEEMENRGRPPSPDRIGAIMRRPDGDKLPGDGNELIRTARGLTDLEIGMYALLGVFCLAILVFLINCISYTLKYRHKELSIEGQENMNHAHDWVWLGNEVELLESEISLSPQQEEQTSMIDSSSGLEEGSHLLNGGSAQKNIQSQVHRAADTGCLAREGKGESPTTKRKRVQFTTFTTMPSDSSYPTVSTLTRCHNQDIKWVCQDVALADSKELRNYMEQLNDSALKEVA
uniref:Transmembrane protein 132C n=1 Tax=Hippocampus comes TaxID=109280 RepID=A0A3Q3DGG2_HIPCM